MVQKASEGPVNLLTLHHVSCLDKQNETAYLLDMNVSQSQLTFCKHVDKLFFNNIFLYVCSAGEGSIFVP